MANQVLGILIKRQTRFAGDGVITGTVTVAAVPAARRVVLRHRRSGIAVANVFSASDGTYQFTTLDPTQEYDVHVSDWSRTWKDYIEPAVVPAL